MLKIVGRKISTRMIGMNIAAEMIVAIEIIIIITVKIAITFMKIVMMKEKVIDQNIMVETGMIRDATIILVMAGFINDLIIIR